MRRCFPSSFVLLTSALTVALLALGGCGEGSSEPTPPPPAPTRTIGGSVSGLTGSGLVLQNNAGNDLSIASDGAFTFTSAVAQGAAYAVSIKTQPLGQTCTVSNGSGTAGSANVTAVTVSCAAAITISGFVYVSSAIDPGNNKITAYSINTANGSLTAVAGSPFATGGIPDGLAVSPSGKFLVVPNETTQNVSVYAVNANTGVLTPVPGSPFAGVAGGSPADAVFDRSGAFLYVLNSATDNLTVYDVDINTGALTLRKTVTVGVRPQSLNLDPSGKFLLVTNGGPDFPRAHQDDWLCIRWLFSTQSPRERHKILSPWKRSRSPLGSGRVRADSYRIGALINSRLQK